MTTLDECAEPSPQQHSRQAKRWQNVAIPSKTGWRQFVQAQVFTRLSAQRQEFDLQLAGLPRLKNDDP